jgi:energy-coupling factor transporter ATP-binding protein EcfA2
MMILESIRYEEFLDQPTAWHLHDLTLEKTNLLVGKNSTGKSRTLNVIAALASILSAKPRQSFVSGRWDVTLKSTSESIDKTDEKTYRYQIQFEHGVVVEESLTSGRKRLISRNSEGKGKIYGTKLRRHFDFQVPKDHVVAVSRRDPSQHAYLEELFAWANSVKYFRCGSDLGQPVAAVFMPRPEESLVPWSQIDAAIALYKRGMQEFGNKFNSAILKDFAEIGYPCTEIGLVPLGTGGIPIHGPLPEVLYVQETELTCKTHQTEMSQGMFRALAVVIALNAGVFSSEFQLVLIDDIAEGLDFERSRALINLLIERSETNSFQLLMSTNDRFTMNAVPLGFWSILHRNGNVVTSINHRNAKKKFKDFKFLGLNNFDFFAGQHFLDPNSDSDEKNSSLR